MHVHYPIIPCFSWWYKIVFTNLSPSCVMKQFCNLSIACKLLCYKELINLTCFHFTLLAVFLSVIALSWDLGMNLKKKRTYLYDSHKSHQPYVAMLWPSETKRLLPNNCNLFNQNQFWKLWIYEFFLSSRVPVQLHLY